MISKELEAKILRLYHIEKWKIGTISTQLHVHHSAVRRALAQSGAQEAVKMKRASMIEPFLPFVKQTLDRYPRLTASRLYQIGPGARLPSSCPETACFCAAEW